MSFAAIEGNKMTVNWTNGNGTNGHHNGNSGGNGNGNWKGDARTVRPGELLTNR